jgi:group II intron reverse transcriptase/maturase
MAWTTLAHHVDMELLQEAYRQVRKDGAIGVDGRSAAEYAEDLEANLTSLLERFHSGRYRAPPVRRVHIPKDRGKTRPIGVPTFEDKVLQRAVTMVLSAVYEQDFLPCSYGFRPGRSAHQAVEDLRNGLMEMWGGYVIELDIESFFDSIDHAVLREFLDARIRDGVIRRAIGKWLNAGVLEEGAVRYPERGSPQGGVISPLLANIYLHEVLDLWFERDVKPRMKDRCFMVRYADDAVLVFAREEDAHRVLETLPKRFDKYGLRLHPEKTRLVRFVSPGRRKDGPGDGDGSGSFDFLGFTYHWGKSKKGNDVVKQKTAKGRLSRSLRRISEWCRRSRHRPVAEQHRVLSQKMRGHYAYYGITGNHRSIGCFADQVRAIWRKWLDRRSWRARMSWERFYRLLGRYALPAPRIVHSYVARP